MSVHDLLRVIKRAERERMAQRAAGDAGLGLSARKQARSLAATVRQWIGESRRTRETW